MSREIDNFSELTNRYYRHTTEVATLGMGLVVAVLAVAAALARTAVAAGICRLLPYVGRIGGAGPGVLSDWLRSVRSRWWSRWPC